MTPDEIAPQPIDIEVSSPSGEEIPGGFQNPPTVSTEYNVPGAEKPEEMSYGDWMLVAGKPLSARHKRLAELLAQGKKTSEIAEALGYTVGRVSVLKSNTQILEEADRVRDRLFSATVQEQLLKLGPDAVSTVEELLRSPTEKLSTRAETARWLIEKLTGKARQEVGVEAGASLIQLMRQLDALKTSAAGTPERDVIELAQGHKDESDWMDTWVTQNIPGVAGEKT